MKKKYNPVPERLETLAKQLNLAISVVKLAHDGPGPKIEMTSIGGIQTAYEAHRLLKQSQSDARSHAILKKWIAVANQPWDLQYTFSEEWETSGFYNDTYLRGLYFAKWDNIVDEFISEGSWGSLFELHKRCPDQHLRDKVVFSLFNICTSVEKARTFLQTLLEDGRLERDDKSALSEFWMFLGKAAGYAKPEEAGEILKTFCAGSLFDPEQPACKLLVQKAVL